MSTLPSLAQLPATPANPFDLFTLFLTAFSACTTRNPSMNMATIDEEHGVLARTVAFHGLTDDGKIRIITERHSRKYQNIKQDKRVALTLLFSTSGTTCDPYTRQIRVNGIAKELSKKEIAAYWPDEPLFAKIRSYICDCNTPHTWDNLKVAFEQILQDYVDGRNCLAQTPTYTVIEVTPRILDFFHTGNNKISDRVIYRKKKNNWTMDRICC